MSESSSDVVASSSAAAAAAAATETSPLLSRRPFSSSVVVQIPEAHCCGCGVSVNTMDKAGGILGELCCFWRMKNEVFDGSDRRRIALQNEMVKVRGHMITRYQRADMVRDYTSYAVAFLIAFLEAVRLMVNDLLSKQDPPDVRNIDKVNIGMHFMIVSIPILAAIIYKVATRCVKESLIFEENIRSQLTRAEGSPGSALGTVIFPPVPPDPDDTSTAMKI